LKANQEFLTNIARLRRRIIKRELKRLFYNTCLLSSFLIAVALGVHKLGLTQWNGNSIYALLVMVSLAFSLLIILRTKKSFMDELIEIDDRLELKDRISTAYEYYQLERESVFIDLLIKEAISFIKKIKPEPVLPRKFSPTHILTPLFLLVIIVLLFVDLTPKVTQQDLTYQEALEKISQKMDKYSKREIQAAKKKKKPSAENLYRRMEELAKELKTKKMTEKRALQSLGELRQEVEAEQTRLARKLEAELSLGDASNTPALKNLQNKKITPDDVNDFKKQVKQAFEQKIPASLSEDLSSLDNSQKLEQFLDETMKEIKSAVLEKGESSSAEDEKNQFTAQVLEEQGLQDTKANQGQAAQPEGKEKGKKPVSQAAGKGESDTKKPEDDTPAPDEDQAYVAGRGKADDQRKPSYELKGSKGPALKDKGETGPGESYNIHVRSLPTIARAKLKEEEVIGSYQQELENVLQKEDIPLNYREYIKNYFLSIGLRKETNGKLDTN